MMKASRWVSAAIVGVAFCWQATSDATVVRAVPLGALVEASDWIVVATVTDAKSHYADVGGARRVVTDTTLQLDLPLTLDRSGAGEASDTLTVRTLGGTMGTVAHVVLGEAALRPGSTNLLFLRQADDGEFHVSAMAQGEYVVSTDDDGQLRLHRSSGLDAITNPEQSAVAALSNRTLEQAEALVAVNAGKARMIP
jgi:hypothetical protein